MQKSNFYNLKREHSCTQGCSEDEIKNLKGSSTVYARAVEIDDKIALQYWMFYAFSTIPTSDLENTPVYHEADWEVVQILIDKNDESTGHITASQHYVSTSKNLSDDTKIYTALGSHASFLEEGKHPPIFTDKHFLSTDIEINLKNGVELCKLVSSPEDCESANDIASKDVKLDYEIQYLQDESIIFQWQGLWDQQQTLPSPKYRSGRVNIFDNPIGFFNTSTK